MCTYNLFWKSLVLPTYVSFHPVDVFLLIHEGSELDDNHHNLTNSSLKLHSDKKNFLLHNSGRGFFKIILVSAKIYAANINMHDWVYRLSTPLTAIYLKIMQIPNKTPIEQYFNINLSKCINMMLCLSVNVDMCKT